MKNIIKILSIAIIAILPIVSQAQNTNPRQYAREYSEFVLKNPNNNAVGLRIGDPVEKCIEIFGQPQKIETVITESTEEEVKIYHYNNNKLDFIDGKLVQWVLNDATIYVGKVNGFSYKIGDECNFETRKVSLYPGSTSTLPITVGVFRDFDYEGNDDSLNRKFRGYIKTTDGTIPDVFLYLTFDKKNVLTQILYCIPE